MLGYYTHVTLHTVFERINLKDAGVSLPGLYRIAGQIATRLLLLAGDVSVLLPSFRSELINNYGVSPQRVHFRPHGTFKAEQTTEVLQPDHTERTHAEHVILAFGYWGTYKRVDLLLESMDEISRKVPNAVLVVAGTNHPSTPGYLESLQQRWQRRIPVRFQRGCASGVPIWPAHGCGANSRDDGNGGGGRHRNRVLCARGRSRAGEPFNSPAELR